VEEKQKRQKQKELHRRVKEDALDSRYVQLARDKELAMIAMEALRHKGCTFAVNPFASLL